MSGPQIRKCFLRNVRKFHPDKARAFYTDDNFSAEDMSQQPLFHTMSEMTKFLNRASDCLTNRWLRLYYDTSGRLESSIDHSNYESIREVCATWDDASPHKSVGVPPPP